MPEGRRNRIKVGLTLYKDLDPTFFQEWLGWQSELAALSKDQYAGLMSTYMPYVDVAENTIVDQSLRCTCEHVYSAHMAWGRCNSIEICKCERYRAAENWDYLVLVESDNLLPRGWIESVLHYDKPIVSLIYFGKVDIDQRPIPGFIRNKEYTRLSYEQVVEWTAKPDFYEVDSVGMGATAIRRDVLEKWDPWKMPWFQTSQPPPAGIMGQDIAFCLEAKRQGHRIYVDTHFTADHLGPWRSSLRNFLSTNEYRIRRDQMGDPVPQPGPVAVSPNGQVADGGEILLPRLR